MTKYIENKYIKIVELDSTSIRKYNSGVNKSDYIFTLKDPLKNISKMIVNKIEISKYNNISSKKNNNELRIREYIWTGYIESNDILINYMESAPVIAFHIDSIQTIWHQKQSNKRFVLSFWLDTKYIYSPDALFYDEYKGGINKLCHDIKNINAIPKWVKELRNCDQEGNIIQENIKIKTIHYNFWNMIGTDKTSNTGLCFDWTYKITQSDVEHIDIIDCKFDTARNRIISHCNDTNMLYPNSYNEDFILNLHSEPSKSSLIRVMMTLSSSLSKDIMGTCGYNIDTIPLRWSSLYNIMRKKTISFYIDRGINIPDGYYNKEDLKKMISYKIYEFFEYYDKNIDNCGNIIDNLYDTDQPCSNGNPGTINIPDDCEANDYVEKYHRSSILATEPEPLSYPKL